MKIPAGRWLPDLPSLGNPGLTLAVNCIPSLGHYRPIRGLTALTTQAIPATPQGLFLGSRGDSDVLQFVAASNRIYRVPNRTDALIDVSRGGSTYAFGPTDRWRVVQFGGRLIATNWADEIQSFLLQGGSTFGDLSVTAPRAKYIAVVRELPVVAYTFDNVDGEDPFRVRWPGFVNGLPDPTSWTVSLTTQADFQPVEDIGAIRGLTGGAFGTVLGETGLARMTYGGAALFQFDVVERQNGCAIAESVIRYGQNTYFLSTQGWARFDGSTVQLIGREQVDRWFDGDFDHSLPHKMWASAGLEPGIICWLYPSVTSPNGKPNRLLIFNERVPENPWSYAEISGDVLGFAATFGLDLDDVSQFPDLDLHDGNLDDPLQWASGVRLGVVHQNAIQSFTGAIRVGGFEFGEIEMADGFRSALQRAVVLHSGGTPLVRVGKREQQGGARAFAGPYGPQPDGVVRMKECARYHTMRIEMSGDWRQMQGIDLMGAQLGMR